MLRAQGASRFLASLALTQLGLAGSMKAKPEVGNRNLQGTHLLH